MEGVDQDSGAQAALLVPRMGTGKIRKERVGISRAQEQFLKKEIRRRLKMGSHEGRKDAKKLKKQLTSGLKERQIPRNELTMEE